MDKAKMGAMYKVWQEPLQWLLTARELAYSAEQLMIAAEAQEPIYNAAYRDAVRLLSEDQRQVEIKAMRPRYLPAILLYGYAIENLLKGLSAVRDPGRKSEETSKGFHGHVSSAFARSVGFSPTADQEAMLDKLNSIVMWQGRYPVAVTVSGHRNIYAGRDDGINPSVDIPMVRSLYERLRSDLGQHASHTPDYDIVLYVQEHQHALVQT